MRVITTNNGMISNLNKTFPKMKIINNYKNINIFEEKI